MNKTISLIAGLAALVAGCTTAPAVKTPSVPEEGRGTGRTTIYERFDRLKELEPRGKIAVSSEEGPERYVMHPITHQVLQIIAGIYAGTVTTSYDSGYPVRGTYCYETHPEAMKKAYLEADSNGDFVITFEEADSLGQRVLP